MTSNGRQGAEGDLLTLFDVGASILTILILIIENPLISGLVYVILSCFDLF